MDDINTSKDIKKQKINFNWDDPFCLDEQLTVDEKLIRDTAKSYASQKLMPRVIDSFKNEKTDKEIFSEMGEIGLLGATVSSRIWWCRD